MQVKTLEASRLDTAVDVLSDAFADYPVMRFVIGSAGDAYARRLRRLIGFFTTARFLNHDLVLGVVAPDGSLVGVANITPPGDRPRSPQLAPLRAALWAELGADALARYEAIGRIWQTFAIPEPHYHLNMIGVRRSAQGRGVSRLLLDAVHDLSARSTESCGVTLTTEDAANVAYYQHFGYAVSGHAQVGGELETWGFFRHNP